MEFELHDLSSTAQTGKPPLSLLWCDYYSRPTQFACCHCDRRLAGALGGAAIPGDSCKQRLASMQNTIEEKLMSDNQVWLPIAHG